MPLRQALPALAALRGKVRNNNPCQALAKASQVKALSAQILRHAAGMQLRLRWRIPSQGWMRASASQKMITRTSLMASCSRGHPSHRWCRNRLPERSSTALRLSSDICRGGAQIPTRSTITRERTGTLGTLLHKVAELKLNGEVQDVPLGVATESQQFERFMADHSSLVPPRTELSMGALKEACKVVQSRLCQASPENAQEHLQIAEARRAQPKRKRCLQ